MKTSKFIAITIVIGACLAVGAVFNAPQSVMAHCQIPCGIYGDEGRFETLLEHITTMEKSINLINELADKDGGQNANQLARWIINKEVHADEFAEIITKYFLQQRLKPTESSAGAAYTSYITQLTLCHEMLVTTMKVKQNSDVAHTKHLSELLEKFHKAYGKK